MVSPHQPHETPVFADPSGRRKNAARRAAFLLFTVVVLLVAWLIPRGVNSPLVDDSGRTLTKAQVGENAPVLGTGPLERVLRVERNDSGKLTGVDPFRGTTTGVFTPQEAAAIGDAPYVIQRYGYVAGQDRTISLTFDDGPDGLITSKLLDVLSANQVPATFFVVGRNVARAPDVVTRMAREGHAVGGHTMTHPEIFNVPQWRQRLELVGTARQLRALTGTAAVMWRMPYTAPEESLEQDTVDGLLAAQKLGFVHASYDFDTLDWLHNAAENETAADIPLPDFSTGENITVLMHDAGGPNRERTVEYVRLLIDAARANGYRFTTMPQANPAISASVAPLTATAADHAWHRILQTVFDLPDRLMTGLFWIAIVFMVIFGAVQAALALWRRHRLSRVVWPTDVQVPTTVLIAAYNEEAVIARTVQAVLASTYPILEVIVVDDGSSDGTGREVLASAGGDQRVRLVRQANGGKASALNNGLRSSRGDVVVTLDADTLITPETVGNLVRHFALPDACHLGAVAGVVRVGNRNTNLLTRWQALEYATQIGLERAAQDMMGAISIVPGACAAWRKAAILDVGGYSSVTLAEDCDLALSLHRHGWKVHQEDEAIALTEAPEIVDDLLKQRSRWTFGTLQAMYKHRSMLFGRGTGFLGWVVMPAYVVSIVIPLLFLPFVAVMAIVTLQTEGPGLLLAFFALFLLMHFALAVVSLRLLREDMRLLWMVPVYRIVFEPLRAYLLFTSVQRMIEGGRMGWNKLERTGSVDDGALVAPPAGTVETAPATIPVDGAEATETTETALVQTTAESEVTV